ncbi:hypothetical protein Tco_1552750, partial [Tanacetum coccineum]
PAYYLLKGTCKSFVKLKYHFEEVYKAVNDRLDWNNPEGQAYLFDLRKSLPLIQDEQGRQVIPVNYFINNDLKYLKGGSSSRKYTTSITKSKAAMESHTGVPKENGFMDMPVILSLIMMCSRLKESLELLTLKLRSGMIMGISKKLKFDASLGSEENLQFGKTFKSGITKLTPYTAYNDPQCIIYQDKIKRHRLMRLDELYKFCDGTLKDVKSVLHDIANNLRMQYLPKRDYNTKDRKRSRIMIKAIDELLFERRLMQNLE